MSSELTNETIIFQCPHNNTGFCKFRDNSKYQHFYTICQKTICRNLECYNKHPKTYKFPEPCKFNSRNACAYKHVNLVDIKSIETENFTLKVKSLEDEIKDLQAEFSRLRNNVPLKEELLRQAKDDLKESKEKNEELKRELTKKLPYITLLNFKRNLLVTVILTLTRRAFQNP